MKLTFGRVIKEGELGSASLLADSEATTARRPGSAARAAPSLPEGRVAPAVVVAAAERASAIVAEARAEAERIVRAAQGRAAELRLQAEAEGRADAVASLAARSLALAAREAEDLEQSFERLVALSRVLAERLLGESLELAPERVVALARQAIAEARGARRVTIVAHPSDAERLTEALSLLSAHGGPELARIVADPERPPHQLRLETDIGVLDAELAPQLERLALKLRETFQR